ncbi:cytochrome c biogenesis CcdA family protein [Methanobrevibacter sp. UBA212]|uniref:cytochrome c biogenesis CcdA family protein n=1 Tax=Methanobrevibacter sp. UBA212 TaxID=1915476 RepID=UPI0025DA9FE1|nr:cytochrome c biogenesis CcdA family protein [Methanobrevibacter sp. UBA212]MEE1151448.1 cytochrome c biogenesis CcdA family protein [Methanobrevibacter sp.]
MEIFPLISFFTGVISILSPCILPVIPIFVAFSLKTKSKSEIVSFTLGLLSVFLVIVLLTGFFTSIVYSYIFYIRIFSAVLLLAIGILMLVDYSFSFSVKLPKESDGIVGSFILGFITSISWAPCYSAYLISLITLLVSSSDWPYAVFNILLYCLGFGLMLFVLSLLISRINLEKLIGKTRYIPKIFAVLIIIGAVYLFWESFKVMI